MKNECYAVVIIYSFDPETVVYLFDSEEAAKSGLRSLYEEELRCDVEDNEWDVKTTFSEDGTSAKIVAFFNDHEEDSVEYRMAKASEFKK